MDYIIHYDIAGFVVVLAILLCMFRLQLFCGFIEPDTGFYVVGTNLGTYFNIALVIVIVAIMVGVVFSKTCVSGPLLSDSTAVVFSASLCGFLFATVLVLGAVEFFANKMQSAFFILEMLLCIPSVIGFFNICAKEKLERSTKNMIFALSPAVFYAVRTIHVFTDTTTQINTSQRSLTLVMLCSMMLLFVKFVELGFVTVLLAHITFSIPYVILNVMPKFRQMDPFLYEAAQDLGCNSRQAFFKVVLPEIMPGVLSGFMMSFTFSLDDFIISYFTSGSDSQTLPVTIYSMTRRKVSPEINALSISLRSFVINLASSLFCLA